MVSQYIWERCLTIARNLSPTSPELRTSHIVFLIKDRVIQHIGINKVKTHPIILRHPYHAGKVYLHAEVDAILKSRKEYLGDYQLVSVRIKANGEAGLGKPCSGCASVIKQFGITEIYWTL